MSVREILLYSEVVNILLDLIGYDIENIKYEKITNNGLDRFLRFLRYLCYVNIIIDNSAKLSKTDFSSFTRVAKENRCSVKIMQVVYRLLKNKKMIE